MTKTVTISITAATSSGTIPSDAVVTFELDGADVDAITGEIVVPDKSSVTLVNGVGSISKWPNARGTGATQYRVTIEGTSYRIAKSITVPDANCDLYSLLQFATIAPDAASAAELAAQGYAAAASVDADEAASSASAASTSASNASTSASAAAASASAASQSATDAQAAAAVQNAAMVAAVTTGTPTSSSTVLGETGGVVRRFAVDEVGPVVSVRKYVTGDGVADDSADFLTAITAAVSGDWPLDLADTTISLATWTPAAVAGTLRLVGRGSGKIVGNGQDLFQPADGASFEMLGVQVEGAGRVLALTAGASYGTIKAADCQISSGKGFLATSAQTIERLELTGNTFDTIADDAVCYSKSYIKSAFICGNRFKDITSSTSDLQVVLLGKTQDTDQALTGNYVVSNNIFDTLESSGSTTGEMHAIILYGDRATISGNIIKGIDRAASRQSEGIEGIYTKCRSVSITGNVLVDAGFAGGNKGGMINVKGDTHSGGNGNDPVGANVVVSGNVLYSTDANARNGIRCEGDNCAITSNVLVGINGAHAIALSWPFADAANALISGNIIAEPIITTAAIWINAVGENISVVENLIEENATGGAYQAIYYTDANRASGAVDRLNISRNQIDATGIDYGIIVQATSRTVTNLAINDNQIKGGGYGIRTLSATYLTSGECRRNRMTGTTTAFRDKATTTLRFSDNTKDNAPVDGWPAAPAAGTWAMGEIVYNSAPAAAGYLGWVCTTAGTPGTWKEFGAIAA